MGKSNSEESPGFSPSKSTPTQKMMCQVLDTVWSEPSSPLIDNNSFFDSLHDPDQLFLLPDSVLAMDSFTFREDVNSIAPNFLSNNSAGSSSNSSSGSTSQPHRSLDAPSSSLRLLEDIEGFRLARASDGCRTLWLCDATSDGSNGPPPNHDGDSNNLAAPSSSDIMQRSTESLSSKKSFSQRSRSECNREREERVKRIREQQESDRRRKLEELKQHALSAQKFRQQQELERRRHIDELRLRDSDKRHQVEERKRVLEETERDRRVALLRKNKEREERIEQKKRAQNQMSYAFGSSTPRMIEPRVDSMSDLWGGTRSRSTSSSNVFAQMSQSMYCNRRSVERDTSSDARKQRATSAHGLDRNDGLSRENTLHPSRPPSGMSTDSRSSVMSAGGVRLRSTPSRRPRPISIATTGVMSSSMYEKRSTNSNHHAFAPSPLAARNRQKSTSSLSGGDLRKKRARSVTSDREEDTKSTASNSSSGVMSKSMTPRRTPAQVKADSAARKAKQSSVPGPPKSSSPACTPTHSGISKSPSLCGSTKSLDGSSEEASSTKSPKSNANGDEISPGENGEPLSSSGKRIINSEEEAKARLAEKRREMKEKKEREAELERARLAEEARLEEERLRHEEEEERLAMEEAEKLAEAARLMEEERLQKAIMEAEKRREEERKKQEEEEKQRKEKEEQERKKQEELSDKLRKEEEERMLRKKRIEEIMSRTRKNNNAATANQANDVKGSSKSSSPVAEKNGEEDDIKDISAGLASHRITNHAQSSSSNNHSSSGGEGTADSVNNNNNVNHSHNNNVLNDNFVKEENAKNSSSKAVGDGGDGGAIHSFISEATDDMDKNGDISIHPSREDIDARQDLDQIMELSADPNDQFSPPSSTTTRPIIAFEESINVPKQEPPTADLLS